MSRKSLSLQSAFEIVVQEMRKLIRVHPMLVIATKATSFGDRIFANDAYRLVPHLLYLGLAVNFFLFIYKLSLMLFFKVKSFCSH